MANVASFQRFTARNPCPICNGYDRQERGEGKRCYGFLSESRHWAHCTRSDKAGGLPLNEESNTYAHRLVGDCMCGVRHDTTQLGQIEATYDYQDADGRILYQTVRFIPKGFSQRQPNGTGGWIWNLQGVTRVLYRLPCIQAAVRAGEAIYVVEGEKDAERLAMLGLCATTNVGGAGKWKASYSDVLRNARVVILPDNDVAGFQHAQKVKQSLQGIAASVKIVCLPHLSEKGDVSDWLAGGGTRDALIALIDDPNIDADLTEVLEQQEAQPNQGNREKRELTLTPLTDLLAEPPESVAYIVEGLLILGGVSILGAKPKVGKSTLARNIGQCVAQGAPFLDRATYQGSVVYLALEEKRSEVAKHFARMGASNEPIYVHVGSAPEEALEELRAAITRFSAVLAIVDPLFKLVRLRDGNDYTEVSRQLEPLIDLARQTGCHLLCAHHLSKGERSGGDAVLGSTALFGAVDTLLLMKRSADGLRTIETIQRYGDDLTPTIVKLDPMTGIVSAGGDVASLKLKDACTTVLKAIGEGTLLEADIRSQIGGNESLTSKALRVLVEQGRVLRAGSGKRGDPFQYSVSRFSRLALYTNQENQETEKQDSTQKPPPSAAALNIFNVYVASGDYMNARGYANSKHEYDWRRQLAQLSQVSV